MSSWQNKRICILGAGVIGLSTACRLLELSNSKLDITILAEAFGESTTSDGAGGLFRPDDRFMNGCDKNLVRYYSYQSLKHCLLANELIN
jgi:glycine/D-amino acid oxidase-like deaminating enzyme